MMFEESQSFFVLLSRITLFWAECQTLSQLTSNVICLWFVHSNSAMHPFLVTIVIIKLLILYVISFIFDYSLSLCLVTIAISIVASLFDSG